MKPLHGKPRSKCFLDVSVGMDAPKRIVVELAVRVCPCCSVMICVPMCAYGDGMQDDIAPKTAENFKKVRFACCESACPRLTCIMMRLCVTLSVVCRGERCWVQGHQVSVESACPSGSVSMFHASVCLISPLSCSSVIMTLASISVKLFTLSICSYHPCVARCVQGSLGEP